MFLVWKHLTCYEWCKWKVIVLVYIRVHLLQTEEGIMLDEVVVNEQLSTDTETVPCFQTPGPTVTFHNLRYRIKERLGMFSRQWVEKDILKEVR